MYLTPIARSAAGQCEGNRAEKTAKRQRECAMSIKVAAVRVLSDSPHRWGFSTVGVFDDGPRGGARPAISVPFVHQHRLADGCARGHIGQDSRRFADRGALGYAHRYLA